MTITREFAVFDVSAEYAHYRRPYAITTALTFPIPTRTALCGLLGAIAGLARNGALTEFTDDKAAIAIQLLEPVRFGHLSLNLLDTKDNRTFRLKPENPHTIMRYEVIREPRYRIFFAHNVLAAVIHDVLARGSTVYTPCCGLAWMVATFDGAPRMTRGSRVEPAARMCVDSATPVRTAAVTGTVEWDSEGVYQRLRMPAEMRPDRTVTRHEEYLIETTGRILRAALREYWRLDDGTCISPL
jgi:CRISPR-associated protein Cas5h